MAEAMKKDWQSQQSFLSDDTIESIYFGGGTPSVFPPSYLQKFIEEIAITKNILPGAEITLEANPEDINMELLKQWKQLGVNRISLGVQSLNNNELTWMNRAHDVEQSKKSVAMIMESGEFELSIDLIYGSPLKSEEDWLEELNWVESSQIHHLSCYALTVEEKTALHKMQQKGVHLVMDKHSTRHFEILNHWASSAGWLHYEISNLCRNSAYKAKHNQRYWYGGHYWGIGPGAHGFNGEIRRWNVANNALYTNWLLNEIGEAYFNIEELSPKNRFNEILMTQLRLLEGLTWSNLKGVVAESEWKRWQIDHHSTLNRWMESGHLEVSDLGLKLTSMGRWLADAITADLMMAVED